MRPAVTNQRQAFKNKNNQSSKQAHKTIFFIINNKKILQVFYALLF